MVLNKNSFTYPAMLSLKGRSCLIIGGGQVAARKLASLLQAQAQVKVIAPSLCEQVLALGSSPQCQLCQRPYDPADLDGAFLVIAATDNKLVNREICALAPCLCNNITEPALSNFTVPSMLSEGDITLALATGGMPAYTKLLKAYFQEKLLPAFSEFNDFLKEQRQLVKTIPSTPQQRTAFWRQTLGMELIRLLEAGQTAQAKEKVIHAVNSFRAQS